MVVLRLKGAVGQAHLHELAPLGITGTILSC
jgi:hypothetical protein